MAEEHITKETISVSKSELSDLLCAATGKNFNLNKAIIELLKAKMMQDYEYINPNFIQDIIEQLRVYYALEDDALNTWSIDLFGT